MFDTYTTLLALYKTKVNAAQVLFTMATVYKSELKDNAKAQEALEKLVQDYPQSRLVASAHTLLKELGKGR